MDLDLDLTTVTVSAAPAYIASHEWDLYSGGCICGARWDRYENDCSTLVPTD